VRRDPSSASGSARLALGGSAVALASALAADYDSRRKRAGSPLREGSAAAAKHCTADHQGHPPSSFCPLREGSAILPRKRLSPVRAYSPLREGSASASRRDSAVSCSAVSVSPFSPLREGSAAKPRKLMRAALRCAVAEGPQLLTAGSAGVDTLGVRRAYAPTLKGRRLGSFALARAALSSAACKKRALDEFEADIYAPSSRLPRRAKWNTLLKIAAKAEAPFQVLPLDPQTIALLGAALKAGGYRSGYSYLSVAKKEHVLARHSWASELDIALTDAKRSLERGIGPSKSAETFGLEKLANLSGCGLRVVRGEPVCLVDTGICMALWLLRGLEAASLLGEQAFVDESESLATIDLGPTKTDPEGRGCKRTLFCACDKARGPVAIAVICPVHSLLAVIGARRSLGLSCKHPLFPQANGRATSADGVRRAFAALLKVNVGEHSFRREGAQFYARRGVELPIIQFLGRWGSDTVKRYVGEALGAQASHAAQVATRSVVRPAGLTDSSFDDVAAALKRLDALEGQREESASQEALQLAVSSAAAVVGGRLDSLEEFVANFTSECLSGVQRNALNTEVQVHRVLLGDCSLPPALWVSACGWKFGLTDHKRVDAVLVSCKKCLRHEARWKDSLNICRP